MKRYTATALIMAMLLLLCGGVPSYSLAETLQAAPLTQDGSATNGMIRVWLSSIRGKSSYTLTVSGGAYTVAGMSIPNGGKVRVDFSGGTVYVTANGGARISMGSSVTVSRQNGGVKIAESLAPDSIYPGDMRFFYSGGTAYVVCYLYIEDYVYGVLPYEMDNSFPLEALKAQAVAARTYAIRAKTSSGNYDVTDTTTHQVFRGVNYSRTRCIQAVDETWGVVIRYGGSYAGAYYSASNGGQTEAANHAWGGSAVGYLTIKDDPYDLANTRAVKKSYLIYSSSAQGSSVSAYTMICNALAAKHGGSANNYTINEITDVMLHTPMYAAPSKLYTQMRVSVTYNGGANTSVDIPIFTTVESTLGLGINGEKNEVYTVEREAKGYRITARRYGHGVGMSQRGAEQMAEMGMSYAQILGFYYTGVQRVRMNFTTSWPTNMQTPAPVEESPGISGGVTEAPGQSGGSMAVVSLTSGTLNFRSGESTTASIIGNIPNRATVAVLEYGAAWSRIRYGNQTGYVMTKYLIISEPAPTSGPVATVPPTAGSGTVVVQLSNPAETLNLRMYPDLAAPVLYRLRHGTELAVEQRLDGWTQVSYLGATGFVMNSFIRDGQPAAVATPTPVNTAPPVGTQGPVESASAWVRTNDGDRLNLRRTASSGSTILDRIPHGTEVPVLEWGTSWTMVRYNGVVGYVSNNYLSIERPGNTAAPTAQPTASAGSGYTSAWARTNDGGGVFLRQTASTSARSLALVPHGAKVTLLEVSAQWCKVIYNGLTGYMWGAYLTFTNPAAGGTEIPQMQSMAAPQATQPPVKNTVVGDKSSVINSGKTMLNSPTAMLSLRSEPNDLAAVRGTIGQGVAVDVLEYYGANVEWLYVRSGPAEGYALAEHFALSYRLARVRLSDADTSLTVRAAADASSGALAWISHGEIVTVLSESNGWARIRLSDNTTGYVSANYLENK